MCLYGDGGSCASSEFCNADIGCMSRVPPLLDCSYAPASSALFYVATDGDDTLGDGSRASPWASIATAIETVPDGATVLVRPGTYMGLIQPARVFSEGIVVRSETPYRAVLRNVGVVVRFFEVAGVTMEGFDIAQFDSPTAGSVIHIEDVGGGRTGRIAFRNNIIHDAHGGALIRVVENANEVVVTGNIFYNSGSMQMHVANAFDALIEGNVFFSDLTPGGRGTDVSGAFVLSEDNGDATARHVIRRNVFVSWEGRTTSGFIEVRRPSEVTVENNLLIGDSSHSMRAPFIINGAVGVLVRHNTIVGDLPSVAMGMAVGDGGRRPAADLVFSNNIWSDPTGTMTAFSVSPPASVASATLSNNLYFNGRAGLPSDSMQALDPSRDDTAIMADPRLGETTTAVPPVWDETSGAFASICEVFEDLVRRYGVPHPLSPAIGAASPGGAPADDIFGRPRSGRTIGAAEALSP